MYIPPVFRENDREKQLAFIREQKIGILVSGAGEVPQATHLPFELVEKLPGQYVLQTHLSRGNAQSKSLVTGEPLGKSPESEVLVIFQGAYGYVSPRWYDHINVPTLNYVAVHVYGKPRLVEDFEELYAMLARQIRKYEGEHTAEYNLTTLPEKFLRAEMRGLIGLEVDVSRIEAAFKLSQNRDGKNYENILRELAKSEDPEDQRLLAEMQKVHPQASSETT